MVIYLGFDGTVVDNYCYPSFGHYKFGSIEVLLNLKKAGHRIIVNSRRGDDSNAIKLALDFLNRTAQSYVWDKDYHDRFFFHEIMRYKITPLEWDLDAAIQKGVLYIDDEAPNIPLKPDYMKLGKVVDWAELHFQFMKYGLYNNESEKCQKILTASGVNGHFEGKIVITLNHLTDIKKQYNPSTKENDYRSVVFHKIEAFVNGESWKCLDRLPSETMVEVESNNIENQLASYISYLANCKHEYSFEENMKSKGYTFEKTHGDFIIPYYF